MRAGQHRQIHLAQEIHEARRERGNGRYNGNRANEDEAAEPATIDVNVLPPSFGSDGMVAPIPDFPVEAEEAAPAPRRRGRPRRPAPEDEVPAEG